MLPIEGRPDGTCMEGALAVKAEFIVLTFFGRSSLWTVIAADTGASLAVIFNSQRLLRPKG